MIVNLVLLLALLSLIENITTSLDAHKHAVGVFMDIMKTFDSIDHDILHKNRPLQICSYFYNRPQYVQFNGMKSGLQNVTFSDTQGSFLGPNCFFCLLMIFAMYQCLISFYMLMTQMFFTNKKIFIFCAKLSVFN